MKVYGESRGIVPLILNLSIRWNWVLNFVPWLLFPQERTNFF